MMTLKDGLVVWALLHTLVLFLLLFQSRYPWKRTFVLTCATMIPLIAVNLLLTAIFGYDRFAVIMLATLSLPSMVFFWILAEHRDGRFFFTFCMVDTVSLEVINIANVLNSFFTPDTHLVGFLLGLIIFPVMEWLVYQKLRPMYQNVQKEIKSGWGIFAVIGALFYVVIAMMMSLHQPITEYPDHLVVLALLFVLMPVIYLHIIITLRHQQKMNHITQQDNLLQVQVAGLTARMQELAAADEKFRMERHNFRHKMKTITSLLETEQYEECRDLLSEYSEALEKTKIKRYCKSTVLDAVLSSYLQKAEKEGICVSFGFAFPDPIEVNESELATVIANALENAINACMKLEKSRRFIDIKVLNHPRFMIRIANSFDGNVRFDENDVPVTEEEGHGFGTRSIVAFCEKHKAYYMFEAQNQTFTLYLNF